MSTLWINVDENPTSAFGIIFLHCARIANITCPGLFQPQECLRPLIEELIDRSHLPAESDAFHGQFHVLKVFRERSFASQVRREVGDHHSTCWYGMYELQRKELPRPNKTAVILINKIKS
jgi:hypothetical protein